MSALLRHVPPVPEGFPARFVSGGWREVERIYGARTDLLIKWIEKVKEKTGVDLYERRRQHMRTRGGNRVSTSGLGAQPCPVR